MMIKLVRPLLIGLAILAAMFQLSFAYADYSCEGNLNDKVIEDNVIVETDKNCNLKNITIKGDIALQDNTGFSGHEIIVEGNLIAVNYKQVNLTYSQLQGSLELRQGDNANINNNQITGDVLSLQNRDSQLYTYNTIQGHLDVQQNTATATIRMNKIAGKLTCLHNRPSPVGRHNRARQGKEGQCLRL